MEATSADGCEGVATGHGIGIDDKERRPAVTNRATAPKAGAECAAAGIEDTGVFEVGTQRCESGDRANDFSCISLAWIRSGLRSVSVASAEG
jgi:hypothetical protein